MKNTMTNGAILTAACFCFFLFVTGFNEEPKYRQATQPAAASSPGLPQTMSFAGEKVPLERWDIREQLDRELVHNFYQTGNIHYMLRLSGRYFPQIEAQLKANDIPDDFKYLCVAESNLQNLVSKAGAAGFWQFMKGTAPGYNLEVAPTIDERYHVSKSTEAACIYLKNAYKRFGSWTAAAASYNCGMGRYNESATYQGTPYYYDLVLPDETQRYVFRILTFKHLLSNADSLGFVVPAAHKYTALKTKEVSISSSIPNLVTFARNNGTSYKIIKWLNPWIRERSLTVKPGKAYVLHLPAE